MSLRSFLRVFYGRVPPDDPSLWHKWTTIFPVRLINGKRERLVGQVWRRRGPDGRWQYKQDDETDEEWSDRQW